jgi:hypothetical protein
VSVDVLQFTVLHNVYEEILLFQTQVEGEAQKGTCASSFNEEKLQIRFANLTINKIFIYYFVIRQSLNKCQGYLKCIVNNEKMSMKIHFSKLKAILVLNIRLRKGYFPAINIYSFDK